MSACPQASSPPSPPSPPLPADTPAGLRWIDIHEAARRSGRNDDHLGRRCKTEWTASGLAQKRPGGERNQTMWWIHESADPVFARAKHTAELDISALTEAKRGQLHRRKQILDDWETALAGGIKLGFTRSQITAQYLQRLDLGDGDAICERTLHNWRQSYQANGMAGLLDERSGRRRGAGEPGPSPFLECLQRLWLTQHRRSIKLCYDLACEKAAQSDCPDGVIPSYKAAQRHIKTLPPQLVIMMREGKKSFEDHCEPAIRRDYSSLNSNDLACGDHHTLDIICLHEGQFIRPTITGWEDMRSRKITGWCIHAHAGNADTIVESFANAVRSHGKPARVLVDNGKDYRGRTLHGRTRREIRLGIAPKRLVGMFQILGIKATYAWIYHGQSKPIERQFRSVCDRFAKTFDTYCGNKPQTKPDDLARQMGLGKAPTLDEVRRAFADYLAGDYHAKAHSGNSMDGKTPAQVFDECLVTKVVVPDAMLEFAAALPHGPVKVSQHGVTYKGLFFGGFDAEVQKLYGKSVMVGINQHDLSYCLILDLEGRLICRARRNITGSFNMDHGMLRAAIVEKKQLRRTMAAYVKQRPRMAEDIGQLVARKAAQRQLAARANPTEPPPPLPPLQPHRTPFDDQLPAIQRAFDAQPQRLAVGAEQLSAFTYKPRPASEDEPHGATFTYHGHGSATEES